MLALLYGAVLLPVVLGLGWLAVRLRRDYPDQPGATALAVALVGCGGYAAIDAAEALATTTTWKYVFVVAQTVPYELIGPAILVFSLEYTGVNRYVNRYLVAALAVVPTVTILTLVGHPLAGVDLYFSNLTVEPYAYSLETLDYDPGLWFFVDGFNTVLLATLGAGQFLLLSIRSTGMYRRQGRLLFVGLLVPLVAGFANIVLFPDAPMDLAPPTFAVTWLAIGFALFRSELLAVVPVDWHSLIDQLAEAVFVVDPQGRIVQANAAAATLLAGSGPGTGIASAAGTRVATRSGGALVGASAATTLSETFEVDLATVDDGDVLAVDDPHVADDTGTSDGPVSRRFETRIRTVEDARGRQRGRLFLLYDVTERVALERRIRTQYEQLDVLNRLLRHDIRNDVSVAIGWGERLQTDLGRDVPGDSGGTAPADGEADGLTAAERLDHVDAVLTANRHIEELTLVARDISRSVASDDDVELEPVDVGARLRDAVATATTSYEDAVFDEPATYPTVHVEANETLGSVFTNLLNNAVQHNDSDVPHVAVTISVDEDTVTVVVADDGPGIPDSRREAIFGRGEKGAESSGTGVGLYLVDQLVDDFGGTVRVEDAALGGAAFVVELPLADD
ncbi:sensor histidine kinase [Haloarchaeobius iranensis]|uniref:histidine kinase n=1 Tax=Haloarchaeobius iranensis TaxID=996166 RepID=A0A1G9SB40_9EURY|nr:histidine kinase N-terminal 7TM domain-containing protein [Haloarchaeobius iranensis]SDM32698.1 Signal transduction histidine kinase [Haloarchaeobius iranensis]